MNVGDVQSFLTSVAALLNAHKGTTPANEFTAFGAALEPFKEQSLGTFTQFLGDAAEFKRTGKVPVAEAKKGRATGGARKAAAPKPKLKTKDDGEAIQEAVTRLQGLYDRFADPTLTHAMIEAEVEKISGEFDAEGFKAVARKFGLSSGLTSKPAVKTKILNRIVERKGSYERSEAFSAASTPLSSPPKTEAGPAAPVVEVIPD